MIKTQWKKCIVVILILTVVFLWWKVRMSDKTWYEETVVPAGSETFIASTTVINSIAFCNEDPDAETILDRSDVITAVDIVITDGNGTEIANISAENPNIHTNGFSNLERVQFTGLPVQLTVGEQYRIQYHALASTGGESIALDHLTIALYGEAHSFSWLLLPVLISVLLIITGAAGYQKSAGWRSMILVWIGVSALTFFIMPMLKTPDENRAFGNLYHVSSVIQGKEELNDDGKIAIDQSGILNDRYLSYTVPYGRFLFDHHYGNDPAKVRYSSQYKYYGDLLLPQQLPGMFAMTLARLCSLPYQWVYLSVWAAGWIVTLLLLRAAWKLSVSTAARHFIAAMLFLPSFTMGAMSASGVGVFVGLCLLWIALMQRVKQGREEHGYQIHFIILSLVLGCTLAMTTWNLVRNGWSLARVENKNLIVNAVNAIVHPVAGYTYEKTSDWMYLGIYLSLTAVVISAVTMIRGRREGSSSDHTQRMMVLLSMIGAMITVFSRIAYI